MKLNCYLPLCFNEPEMRDAAAKICRDFLHGAWKTIAPQDLIFKRISGGLSNFLYYVALPEKISSSPIRQTSPVPIEDKSSITIEDKSPSSLVDDKEKKSTIRKLLGRSLSRQTSFLMEEPKKVLIRIYGENERCVDNIIMDSVIFTLLSERRLGPRLHGVFSGGRIEQFIPARQLSTKELSEPALSMKIAEKMAAIHSMDVPLCKEPQWLWKKIQKWHQSVTNILEGFDYNDKNQEVVEIVKKLKKCNYAKEIDWLKNFLSTVNSPVVFCHNDMQEGNILLKEEEVPQSDGANDDVNIDYSSIHHDSSTDSFCETVKDNFTNKSATNNRLCNTESTMDVSENEKSDGDIKIRRNKKRKASFNMDDDCDTTDSVCSHASDDSMGNDEPKLVIIDYEYCSYNHRGFDLANHFIEWAYDYTNPNYPYYYENFENYPSLEQKEIFMKQYLLKINGEEMPSLEELNHLNMEVESFTLASHMFWSLWAVINAPKSQIPFGYWEYALSRIEWYFRLKQDIIKKNNNVTSLKRKIREVDI